MRSGSLAARGFSLVEITLALGIAAVALTAVIGLLGVAVDADGAAGRDTIFVAMTNHVLGDLRAVPFDALWDENPKSVQTPVLATSAPAATSYLFDGEGVLIPATESGAAPPEAIYECTVVKFPDEVTRAANRGPHNLMRLQLEFTWPITSHSDPAQRRNRKLIHGSIARY